MKRIALAVVLVLGLDSRANAVVPAGFEDVVLTGMISPTGLAFTPDGFYSRNAGSSRPELAIASEAPPASTDDVVLYGVDATAYAGTWQLVADSTAAAGIRMHNPDSGSPKLTSALASPAHFAEGSFAAEAGRAYRLWIRGRADGNAYVNDSVFVQFSTSVTASGSATYRIGTTSATAYVLEDCSGCGVNGWGWQDNGYGTGVMGPLIYFAATGPQTIRIQVREDGLSIDQIVLSPARHLNTAPGAVRNDATIVPKP